MDEVNVIYQKIILEFLFELYVFYALTTRKLNRAPRFWVRALAGLGGVLTLSYGLLLPLLWGYGPWADWHLHLPVCRYRGPCAAVLSRVLPHHFILLQCGLRSPKPVL